MNYLGSNRAVTQDYSIHKTAEDYAGSHLSDVKISGTACVTKVINKFKPYEDSINYNNYLNNRNNWKDGNYYNCVSISGKKTKMHYNELGGNQVYLETNYNNQKMILRICHLADVCVNVGDIVNQSTIIGHQGNTGLVLSSKSLSDTSYGSHVHLEVMNKDGVFQNPRGFADGTYDLFYKNQSNELNINKNQLKVLVDKINIRRSSSETSEDIGNVYEGEIYDILDIFDSEIYTWYRIKTSNNVEGFVANKKDSQWVKIYAPNIDINDELNKENDSVSEEKKEDNKILIFTCEKSDYYYIKLEKGEKLFFEKN